MPLREDNAMISRNQKNFEFKLGLKGFILFIGGMSLLLVVVFIAGVLIGMHIDAYPEIIARDMPEIIRRQLYHPKEKIPETASVPVAVPHPPKDDESVNRPAGMEANIPPQPAPSGAVSAPAVEKTPPLEEATSVKSPAPPAEKGTVNKPVSPAGQPKQPEKPAPSTDQPKATDKPAIKVVGSYIVQAGSFRNNDKAKELCQKITQIGHKPQIITMASPKSGTWHRVVIRGFETREEAAAAANTLSEKIKGISCFIRKVK